MHALTVALASAFMLVGAFSGVGRAATGAGPALGVATPIGDWTVTVPSPCGNSWS